MLTPFIGRGWRANLAFVFGSLLVGTLLISGAFYIFRMQQLQALELRVTSLETFYRTGVLQYEARVAEIDIRLDDLEQIVFADVLPKVERNRKQILTERRSAASHLEQRMLQKERETRQRIEQLEQWRLRGGGKNR